MSKSWNELLRHWRSSSKIFVVCDRLISYLDKYSILYGGQYGFRSNHDTTMAVIDMVDKISK